MLNFALVVRHRSLTGFLTVAPLPLAPLIAAPLAHLTGVVDHPLAVPRAHDRGGGLIRFGIDPTAPLSPGRAASDRLPAAGHRRRGRGSPGVASTTSSADPAGCGHPRAAAPPMAPHGLAAPRWWISTAAPRCAVALLTVVLAGPILLAVALRLGYPPLADYLHTRFGFDLAPYQPVLLASLVVLHVPLIIGMVGALLILDDIDDRTVLILRVSPVTVPRYLAYRAITVAAVALLMLAIAVPVSGLAPDLPACCPRWHWPPPGPADHPRHHRGRRQQGRRPGLAEDPRPAPHRDRAGHVVAARPAQWPLRALPHYWTVDILWHPTTCRPAHRRRTHRGRRRFLASRTLRRLTHG